MNNIKNIITKENTEVFSDLLSSDALNYGYGLFETIKIYDNKPIFFEEHIERMRKSSQTLQLDFVLNEEEIYKNIKEEILRKNIAEGAIKLNLVKGVNEECFFITSSNKVYGKKFFDEGVALKISNFRKNENSEICHHKTNNYLESILEKRRAEKEGFFDSIFLNSKNIIAETTIANIFFVKNNKILTPKIESGILPGIVRNKVFKICESINLEIEEGLYTEDIIKESEEVFITNSLMGIMPVKKIGVTEYGESKQTINGLREYYEEKLLKGIC